MFEQTLLPDFQNSRKPYSMALSLILQILVLGALCLVPIVFTQVLPMMQLKSVLAAPPKPPVAMKARAVAASSAAAPRIFRVSALTFRPAKPIPATEPRIDAPPEIGAVEGGDPSGTSGGMSASLMASVPQAMPLTPPAVKKTSTHPITVGSVLAAANLIHMVQPQYPQMARMTRVQGAVEFTATISKEGSIENLTLVRGHPLLINAAREAVLQWRYRPTLLNGHPVEVITDIVVNFTLN